MRTLLNPLVWMLHGPNIKKRDPTILHPPRRPDTKWNCILQITYQPGKHYNSFALVADYLKCRR